MWPKSQDYNMSLKAIGVRSAVRKLCKETSALKKSTKRNLSTSEQMKNLRDMAEAIIVSYFDSREYGNENTDACIDAIAAAALAPEDSKMYMDMLKAPKANYISVTNWIAGIKAFGFPAIREQ